MGNLMVEQAATQGVPSAQTSPGNWAVVGGGLLGMTIAKNLAQSGAEVTLYETEPELGGLASAWTIDNTVWDRYYHVILLSDSFTRDLLKELDLEQDMAWVESKTGFFTQGQFYSMSSTIEFLRFPPLGLIDKFRLGWTIFSTSKIRDWRRLENIPVADFLTQLSGRRTFERIWLPLLRAKLGENYSRTSAVFIWATIARMYAARRTGLKKEMFGYLPGGYARILERYTDHLQAQNVKVLTSCPVDGVTATDNGRICVTSGQKSCLHDQVVMTVPSPVAAEICPTLPDSERSALHDMAYQGVICASILLKRPLSPYYITNITDSWVPFTAVIEMSALVDRRQWGGHSLVYLPKYVASGDPAFDTPDAELKREWLAALSRMHPSLQPDDILDFKISRTRHVHALTTLDYSRNLPPLATSIPGVHLVNSAHIVSGTTNVNETVALAHRWARSIQSSPAKAPEK